tara:strand:- start:848 stop:1060 length:213 start_codon:yes stop_codon:yes gene_type:complete
VSSANGNEGVKHQARFERIHDAMKEVVSICDTAVKKTEKEEGNFKAALREYFHRIHKNTNIFHRSGLNKK